MIHSYPDDRTQKAHIFIVKAWSLLPQGRVKKGEFIPRTYTLKQARDKAIKTENEHVLKFFRIVSQSETCNFKKIGRFLKRLSEFTFNSLRFESVDRGDMLAWKLVPSSEPDTLPFVPSVKAEPKYKIDLEELLEAWEDLPEQRFGLTVREAVRLTRTDPKTCAKLLAILSNFPVQARTIRLKNALRNAVKFGMMETEVHERKIPPRRRLRKNVKRRLRPRVWMDPSLVRHVAVDVFWSPVEE